jgi:hypothetical protein
MTNPKKLNRRQFLGLTGSAVALSVVPRHVLGGVNYVAPSDKITLGLIGSGTQQIRELTRLITDPRIQVVSVCDPVKNATGYRDWSQHGIRNSVRQLLEDPSWGSNIAIPGGRDTGQEIVNKYYSKNRPGGSYKGCTAYEDFREMLDREPDMAAVKIITPDHQHGVQAIAAMKKGKHVIMHKPVANVVHEARVVAETARKTGVITHLLAWSDRSSYGLVKKWIDDGAIGTLKEIHNWSFRPVWEQWTMRPADNPPVPAGFNWPLWLGPVPDRPYHPCYTHATYRGWFDFGAGSVADMGIYSLWQLFPTFGITALPVSIEALGGTTRRTDENGVFSEVPIAEAFPYTNIYRWKFPAAGKSPKFDLFWYDGGMKPHNPPEMEEDNRELDSEGMMFVGDKGKILAGFNCNNPRIIPEARMIAHTGSANPPDDKTISTDVWIDALANNRQSPGSFQNAELCNETALLVVPALRARRKIHYDPARMEITNVPEANRFLRRQEYRKGWEI